MKLSVVIPVFNQENYIEQCINSVLSQSYQDFEVVVIDDGSTDRTIEIVNNIARDDPRLKIYKSLGKGAGAARNYGLKIAKGEAIHFLDSDDWVEKSIYTELVDELLDSDVDYVTFCYKKFDNVSGKSNEVNLYPMKKDRKITVEKSEWEHIFLKTSVVPWNKIYKRSFIENILFDEVHVCNDRAFYFRCLKQANSIHVSSKYYLNYRVNNSNSLVGSKRGDYFLDIINTSRNIDEIYLDLPIEKKSIVVDINIRDILFFFEKCTDAQKARNFQSLQAYLETVDTSCFGDKVIEKKWYSNFCAIKNRVNISSKEVVPIVFATNDNYAPYMMVAIRSLLDNFKKQDKYYLDINILHSGLSDDFVNSVIEEKDNYKISAINVAGLVADQMKYVRAHYSKEMYYRLLISEIFNFHKKVIYLDCDIVVNADITELYNVDIGENIIAGVLNFCNQGMRDWIENGLKLNSKEYINSGILIINVSEFNKHDIKNKCFEFSNKRNFLACPDQDMLNFTCKGKILFLDSGWNFQWHHAFKKYKYSDTAPEWKGLVENARKKQYVTHFTSGIKPWSHPIYENSERFWDVAVLTKCYNQILTTNIENKLSKLVEKFNG